MGLLKLIQMDLCLYISCGGAVCKVISYTSRLVDPLFNTGGVTAEEQSQLCCIFLSPTDLRGEFIAYLPRTFSFVDASGAVEPSNTNDEACDTPAASPEAIVIELVRMFAD